MLSLSVILLVSPQTLAVVLLKPGVPTPLLDLFPVETTSEVSSWYLGLYSYTDQPNPPYTISGGTTFPPGSSYYYGDEITGSAFNYGTDVYYAYQGIPQFAPLASGFITVNSDYKESSITIPLVVLQKQVLTGGYCDVYPGYSGYPCFSRYNTIEGPFTFSVNPTTFESAVINSVTPFFGHGRLFEGTLIEKGQMGAQFIPNFNLSIPEVLQLPSTTGLPKFDHFNWSQQITKISLVDDSGKTILENLSDLSDLSDLFEAGCTFIKACDIGKAILEYLSGLVGDTEKTIVEYLSGRAPGPDPELGGNKNQRRKCGNQPARDNYPWYWDEIKTGCGTGNDSPLNYFVETHTFANGLDISDAPNLIIPGLRVEFETYLAGVNKDHKGRVLALNGTSFKWAYTQTLPFIDGITNAITLQNINPDLAGKGEVEFLGFINQNDFDSSRINNLIAAGLFPQTITSIDEPNLLIMMISSFFLWTFFRLFRCLRGSPYIQCHLVKPPCTPDETRRGARAPCAVNFDPVVCVRGHGRHAASVGRISKRRAD